MGILTVQIQNLDADTVITIEDYQQNIEIEYSESPISLAYSCNKTTYAVYPLCIEFLNENFSLQKAAVTLITDDKSHDHQQVQKFEERLFQIVEEKLHKRFKRWIRFSDGCRGQFKSRFCVANQFAACALFGFESVWWHFFESHEGKSSSDSIGVVVKCALRRGILKRKLDLPQSSGQTH